MKASTTLIDLTHTYQISILHNLFTLATQILHKDTDEESHHKYSYKNSISYSEPQKWFFWRWIHAEKQTVCEIEHDGQEVQVEKERLEQKVESLVEH